MSLIYTPKRFDPRELISPAIYDLLGADALYLYDPLILEGADQLSIHFGGFIANTWHSPRLAAKYGRHRFRGLRAKNQKIGANLSAHKVGIKKLDPRPRPGLVPYSAIDGVTPRVPIPELHAALKKDSGYWSRFFKRIETHKPNGDYITWFHGDSKPHAGQGIKFFRP